VIPRALGYAPLLPFAAATTAGLVADRYLLVASTTWFILAASGVIVWLAAFRRHELASLAGLWICAGGLAGAYHHSWRNDFPADDIGHLAAVEAKLVRVRGSLAEEPAVRHRPKDDPLKAQPRQQSTVAVLRVAEVDEGGTWVPASGRVQLTIEGVPTGLHIGDEVEVTGWLSRPVGQLNPGEWDYPSHLRDDRILAELRVRHTSDGIVRLETGSWSLSRSLSSVRDWGQRGINERISEEEGPVAAALLLGDNNAMTADDWERYVRTGVVHVLAISGQHLVILGAFLWFILRILGVKRRPAAMLVATVLLGYALMTGGRPSAVRAAVIACAICGSILFRARSLPANSFSLAWIVVLILNPTDLFTAGFQLSFLCVAVLIWGIPRWFPPRQRTPLEELIEESRSVPVRLFRETLRGVGQAYLITLVLGLSTAPLVAYWQNLVSPAGMLIGPAAILLTTIALLAGFMLLLLWPLGPVTIPFALIVSWSLAICEWIVSWAERMPGGCWYVGLVPSWWIVGFYAIGITWLFVRLRSRMFPAALCAWTLLGLSASLVRPESDELRVTFVSVDHGGCAVIETPDGRVMLYDTGATGGPDVTKRHIAPYLWSRGIRRIDEIFLSHADLDHFNGLPALLDRFSVGQITMTPTFADKATPGVRVALEAMEKRGVAIRIANAGDHFVAGDVEIDVLHPPCDGPPGVENIRSMVLLIQHRGHRILLTGDLEGAGLDRVTATPAPPIDVLMTPHHGSGAGSEKLANWARPKLVVSSQGRADAGKASDAYAKRGIPYWATWPNGAITIRSHATGLTAETFATNQRIVVRSGSGESGSRSK
jgi:competence protein ComEC